MCRRAVITSYLHRQIQGKYNSPKQREKLSYFPRADLFCHQRPGAQLEETGMALLFSFFLSNCVLECCAWWWPGAWITQAGCWSPPALYTTKGYRQSGWNTLNVWEKFFGSFSEAVSLYYTVGHENSCSVHALRMDHSVLLPNNRGK